jgi:hypothetical protein
MAKQYRSLNELHFLDRQEFLQMAPTIVQMELSRLTGIAEALEPGSAEHTAVVSARHQLRLFQDAFPAASDAVQAMPPVERLEAAILCLSTDESRVDAVTYESLIYVADRLGYIASQMRRLR